MTWFVAPKLASSSPSPWEKLWPCPASCDSGSSSSCLWFSAGASVASSSLAIWGCGWCDVSGPTFPGAKPRLPYAFIQGIPRTILGNFSGNLLEMWSSQHYHITNTDRTHENSQLRKNMALSKHVCRIQMLKIMLIVQDRGCLVLRETHLENSQNPMVLSQWWTAKESHTFDPRLFESLSKNGPPRCIEHHSFPPMKLETIPVKLPLFLRWHSDLLVRIHIHWI